MYVVVEMDGGYSGDPEYVSQIFGPFVSEEMAEMYRRSRRDRYNLTVHEVIPK